MIEPDADAPPLDRFLMELANNLEASGWPEDVYEDLRTAATHLRETWKSGIGPGSGGAFDALSFIEESAARAKEIIEKTTPLV